MTEYARIENGVIVRTLLEPSGILSSDGAEWDGRDWDFRDPSVRNDWLTSHGWVPITEVPRPADTATTTSDPAPVALVAGVPTQQWTVRPWTQEELDDRFRAENAARLQAEAVVDDPKILGVIERLGGVLLGANTVTGSIRAWRGTVTNSYNANVLRSIAGVLIDIVQEQRKMARQLARLSKLSTGDTSSSDVGSE